MTTLTVAPKPDSSLRNKMLLRTKGTRLIETSCSSDASRNLITHHHKSLAKIAWQSMRTTLVSQISTGSTGASTSEAAVRTALVSQISTGTTGTSSSSSEAAELTPEDLRRQKSNDLRAFRLSGVSDNNNSLANYLAPPVPLQRGDTFGVDDLGLEVLCMHVSELMGGAPIPSASIALRPPSQQENSAAAAMPTIFDDSQENLDWEDSPELESETSDFRFSQVDMTQQVEAMRQFSNERLPSFSEADLSEPVSTIPHSYGKANQSSLIGDDDDDDDNDNKNDEETPTRLKTTDEIEVSPGEFLPLLASEETFQAIVSGKFAVATCFACMEELSVSKDADLVICSDCWIFSPVDTEKKNDCNDDVLPQYVGMGVKAKEMKTWFGDVDDEEVL